MTRPAEVVIAGAGIAGVAVAWHLAARRGVRDVVLVEERAPLTLTSDKSTECYRNLWPGPGGAMTGLMNRSIDLLEDIARETGNAIRMNRRGYAFATADPAGADALEREAAESCRLGAGTLRVHGPGTGGDYRPAPLEGFEDQPDGVDLIRDPALIRTHFPFLDESVVAVLHARRCGWYSAQQTGMWMLERARDAGARLVTGRLESVAVRGGRVEAVTVGGADGDRRIACENLVLAPGPFLGHLLDLLEVSLPVFCERHVKIAFRDERDGFPAEAPMLIWADPVRLPWSDEERETLAEDPEQRRLLEPMPTGLHGRPEGRTGAHWALGLWTYDMDRVEPVFPLTWDPQYPELVVRGLSVMLPGMRRYLDRLPRCVVDGGFYAKVPDNRPLIGALPVEGAWVASGYSGFGMMASCAAGDLLADAITGAELPPWAEAFEPSRFERPGYLERFRDAAGSGQL